jgi:glycosyltransferase involved in cell wall biosynthesis
MKSRDLPMVSVVIPARNAADCIEGCLEALADQTYPDERYEIIVVDNGSFDSTAEVVRSYPVHLLREPSIPSPYSARNHGIKRTVGDVLAFTDADCRPVERWLERGVDSLMSEGADLVGGRVEFTFSEAASLGEMVDALWHLDVERQIACNRAAMTANLFANRYVFDAIGDFDARVRSGGDGRWTRKATDRGFRLVYAPDAVVRKPARPLGQVLGKAYRVGRGLPAAWAERGQDRYGMGASIAYNLRPPSRTALKTQIRQRGVTQAEGREAPLWLASWLLGVVRSAGCVHGLCEFGKRKSTWQVKDPHADG